MTWSDDLADIERRAARYGTPTIVRIDIRCIDVLEHEEQTGVRARAQPAARIVEHKP